MKLYLRLSLFILFIACQSEKQASTYINLTSQIEEILKEHQFNGVLLLSSDSKDIYAKAVGFSDLEHKTPIDLKDQFVIGSISKQITAVLVLRAYEDGKIQLDHTIDQYLTDIEQPWTKKVTIHHLLTHTHGIIDLNQPLEFKQGSQFHYSQLGYELLAQALEKVTNSTFQKLSTELFEEYGLSSTFHPDNKNYTRLVNGYIETEDGTLKFTTNSLYNYPAAGSFISTAEDLKKWNELLHTGQLVTQETLDLMTTQYATRIHPIFETVEYGYGLLFKKKEQGIQVGALGYAPGFVSACYYHPQTKLNLIILENTAHSLNDFTQTFIVHTKVMELVKKHKEQKPTIKS